MARFSNSDTVEVSYSAVKTLGDGRDADYSTLALAIAGSADWDVLEFQGEFTYDTVTLPAGKTIRGVGSAEECVLTSTNTTAFASVITVGGAGCVLENLTMKTGTGTSIQSRVTGTDTLTCRDMIWLSNVASTNQWWAFYTPTAMHACLISMTPHVVNFPVFSNYNHILTSTRIEQTSADNWFSFLFFNVDGVTATDCVFAGHSAGVARIYSVNGASTSIFSGCLFTGGWSGLFGSTVRGSVSLIGCAMGGVDFGNITTATALTVRVTGCSDRGDDPASTTDTDIIWELDRGWKVAKTAAYTCRGFEDFVACDTETTGAFAVTLPPVAQFLGGRRLRIWDEGQDGNGFAGTNNITITPNGAELINGSNTSLTIDTNNGYIDLELNADGDEWAVVGSYGVQQLGLDHKSLANIGTLTHDEIDERLDTTFSATLTPVGTVETLDFASENRFLRLDLQAASGDVTLTLSNPVEGRSYLLNVIQGAVARDIVWPATVKWSGGSPPVISTTVDNQDDIVITCMDSVTPRYHASVLPDFPA